MTKRNIKTVCITIPTEEALKKCKYVPTFKNLSRLNLKLGENIENVNHTQFSNMNRLYPIIGITVKQINSKQN